MTSTCKIIYHQYNPHHLHKNSLIPRGSLKFCIFKWEKHPYPLFTVACCSYCIIKVQLAQSVKSGISVHNIVESRLNCNQPTIFTKHGWNASSRFITDWQYLDIVFIKLKNMLVVRSHVSNRMYFLPIFFLPLFYCFIFAIVQLSCFTFTLKVHISQ